MLIYKFLNIFVLNSEKKMFVLFLKNLEKVRSIFFNVN